MTPTCLAIWDTILTPLAAKRPDDALGSDDRTPAQRLHDAFEEAGRRLLATGELPDQAGLPCQLIITMTLTDLERRAGRATTHHGGTLSINDALKLAAQGKMLPADPRPRPAASSPTDGNADSPRTANARSSSPGIAAAPSPAAPAPQPNPKSTTPPTGPLGGKTDLDNLAIACGYHNAEAPKTRLANGHAQRHPTLATTNLAPRSSSHYATTSTTPNYSGRHSSSGCASGLSFGGGG